MLSGLAASDREAAWAEVADALRGFEIANGFEGPCEPIAAVGSK